MARPRNCLLIAYTTDLQPRGPEVPREVNDDFARGARTRGFPSPPFGEFGFFDYPLYPFLQAIVVILLYI